MSIVDQQVADIVAEMGVLPEDIWLHDDDACDCTFQRIGLWKNPYIGETLEVRMCCIWAELYKLFPQHVRKTGAYLSGDDEWLIGQAEWNGEAEMPRAIWYRQIARQTGRPLPEIRAEYANQAPPAGTPRPRVEASVQVDMIPLLIRSVEELSREVLALKAKVGE